MSAMWAVKVIEDPMGERWPVYVVGPFASEAAAESWAAGPRTWAFRTHERDVVRMIDPAEQLHPDAAWRRDHRSETR